MRFTAGSAIFCLFRGVFIGLIIRFNSCVVPPRELARNIFLKLDYGRKAAFLDIVKVVDDSNVYLHGFHRVNCFLDKPRSTLRIRDLLVGERNRTENADKNLLRVVDNPLLDVNRGLSRRNHELQEQSSCLVVNGYINV